MIKMLVFSFVFESGFNSCHYLLGIKLQNANDVISEKLYIEPQRGKTNKITCGPSEDSKDAGHPPSLIRVLYVSESSYIHIAHPLLL